MLTLSTSGYSQSDIGECSVEPVIENSIYQLNGDVYRKIDVPIDLQQALYDAELQYYKAQKAIIDQSILLAEVERQASESGKSVDEMAALLFESESPTQEKVKEFYEKNKSRIDSPLESIEGQIIQALIQRDVQEKQLKMLNEIKEKGQFKLTLPKPVAPHAELAVDGFPRKGAKNPSVVIVEFADYQCPHCKEAAGVLSKMVERFPDDLAIIYVDFPINRSGISRTVAEGAVCAAEQGKFWDYHDQAFVEQNTLDNGSPIRIAEGIGLDGELFQNCMTSTQPAQHVNRGEREATRLGINSTPTLFLNGRRLHIHNMASELPTEIETALKNKG